VEWGERRKEMGTFKRLAATVSILHLVFGLIGIWSIGASSAQETVGKLSGSRYVDPKGYFKITPPLGWQTQEYPNDPRGKVAFMGAKDVDLRVLARATDFDSFEGLLKLVKDIERQTGINTNIQKTSFLDRPAIKRSFIFKGSKVLQIDFMEGNIKHNLQYYAPLAIYDKYLAVTTKSMNTYQTILRGAPPQDVQKHAVAQNLRLAQLFLKKGESDLAMEYVQEGLELEPKNPDLLRLKKQIGGEETPQVSLSASRSWNIFEDSKFTIKYPANWVIREQDSDADGYYYSFKDSSPIMGGIGVYFFKQSSIFGSEKSQLTMSEYKEVLLRTANLEGKYVGDIQNNGITGKRFTATQKMSGKPAEWRLDVFPYKKYVGMVFGFCRPDNVEQRKLIYEAIDSYRFVSPAN
jgi:hypothetical protein